MASSNINNELKEKARLLMHECILCRHLKHYLRQFETGQPFTRNQVNINQSTFFHKISGISRSLSQSTWAGINLIKRLRTALFLRVTKVFCSQFHQRFTSMFFVQNFGAKNYKALFWVWNFVAPKFCTKKAHAKRWWNWLLVSISSTFLRTNFFYEHCFGSFSLVTCT